MRVRPWQTRVMAELLDFDGRRVVITGAASGIGAAAAAQFLLAGAEVHAVDIAPAGDTFTHAYVCDLGDPPSVDRLVAELPDRIDVLLNCAGVPNGGRFSPADVMAINWLGLSQLTEGLLPRMPAGSSVVHVASTAGRGWSEHRSELAELVAEKSLEAAGEWVADNPDVVGDGYAFSKEAVQYYTLHRSLETIKLGIRMNSVCPGVTNTPIAPDFVAGVGAEVINRAVAIAGRLAEPEEMAPAMLFLADEASASYINGVNLNVDRGTGAAHATGQW